MKPHGTTPRKRRFVKVLNRRKQPIRNLWKRGDSYYAQLQVDGTQRKVRLAANTTAEAEDELGKLKAKRSEGVLQVVRHAPKLADAIKSYKASPEYLAKRPSTQASETGHLKFWIERLGDTRVDKITKAMILLERDKLGTEGRKPPGRPLAKATKRQEAIIAKPRNPRTVNLYVGSLMQVLNFCEERGQVSRLPKVKWIKPPEPPKRKALSDEQVRALLDALTPETSKNADLLRNFLRFLALTGAREREAARVRWQDVNIEGRKVTIGADGLSKNHEARHVDATDELVELLREMEAVRPPDSAFVFPSPQRGKKDGPALNLRETLRRAKVKAGLPHIGFHDFRHTFISKCVMAGVPHMTIAEWVGHIDGGVLIGKVYGHLSQDHKADMARKLSLYKTPENVVALSATA